MNSYMYVEMTMVKKEQGQDESTKHTSHNYQSLPQQKQISQELQSHQQIASLHPADNGGNPHYQHVCHEHSYTPFIQPRPNRLPSTITQILDQSEATQAIHRVGVDGVYNYASAVLNDGMLLFEFRDAIKEGDGPRILRCWEPTLIYFHHARHHNYAAEAIRLSATVNEPQELLHKSHGVVQ